MGDDMDGIVLEFTLDRVRKRFCPDLAARDDRHLVRQDMMSLRLEAKGHHVLAHKVPIVASCKVRAKALADAIQGEFKNDPAHIITQSMGGLDSRMMIGQNFNGLGEKGRILSLTTLSTPHQGSPLADLLAGKGPDDVRRPLFDALNGV